MQDTQRNSLGFIFDMDGTMIDNMTVHHHAWHELLNSLNYPITLDRVKKEIYGKNEEIFYNLFGEKYTLEERKNLGEEKEKIYRDRYKNDIKLLKGLADFLEQATELKIPMSIGTAAPESNVKFVLETLKLDPYFKAVVHSDIINKGKPDPEVFLKCADKMNLKNENILVFEDSPTGALTAERANMKSIIILTTHHKEEFKGIKNIQKFITDFSQITIQEVVSFLK